MGFDIAFITIREAKRVAKATGKTFKELDYFDFNFNECTSYLSYNFSVFHEIWYARDSFGKTSEEFADDLREASVRLTNWRVDAIVPDGLWENPKTGKKEKYTAWTPELRVFLTFISNDF